MNFPILPNVENYLIKSDVDSLYSDMYGSMHVAAKFAGLELPKKYFVKSIWSHGCRSPWELIAPETLSYGLVPQAQSQRIFVERKEISEFLHKNGFKNVKSISLPINYAAGLGARLPKSLLVMPVHTLIGHDEKDRSIFEEYADLIHKACEGFERIYVCVNSGCRRNGFWIPEFEARGFKIVDGAAGWDLKALVRMRSLFEQFDVVTTNGWGSHVAYALAYGAKVSIFGKNYPISRENLLKDPTWASCPQFIDKLLESQDIECKKLFSKFYVSPKNALADPELGNKLIGTSDKLTKEQMKETILQLVDADFGIHPVKGGRMRRTLFIFENLDATEKNYALLSLLRWIRRETNESFEIWAESGGSLISEASKIASIQVGPIASSMEEIRKYALLCCSFQTAIKNHRFLRDLPGAILLLAPPSQSEWFIHDFRDVAAALSVSSGFVSSSLRSSIHLEDVYGIEESQIFLLPPAYDEKVLLEEKTRNYLNTPFDFFDIPNSAKIIIGGGDISAVHGVDLFIQLVSRIREGLGNGAEFHAIWIGSGSGLFAETMRQDISRLRLDGIFHWANPEISRNKIMKRANLFCSTARENELPFFMVEAAALGKPLISFDFNQGKPGSGSGVEKVQFGDLKTFSSEVIKRLLNDSLCTSEGESASELVLKDHCLQAIGPNFQNLLVDLGAKSLKKRTLRTSAVKSLIEWNLDRLPSQTSEIMAYLKRQQIRQEIRELFRNRQTQLAFDRIVELAKVELAVDNPVRKLEFFSEIIGDTKPWIKGGELEQFEKQAAQLVKNLGAKIEDFYTPLDAEAIEFKYLSRLENVVPHKSLNNGASDNLKEQKNILGCKSESLSSDKKKMQLSNCIPSISLLKTSKKETFWSIMIPAYNPKPEFLNKVLRSVLTALPKGVDAQIEILDDASPNCDVAALVNKMAGMTKVSVHRNMNNLGYIANWNACIERARGEWVHILHQDDYVLPSFYEKISAGLKLHPEAGAAFCRHNHVSAKDETTFTSALERAEPGILENWPERLSSMQRMQFVSTVVRRSTFEKVGGFWSEARSAADWEMWMRIASAVPVFFHPEVLACFRIHNISESSRLLMSGENSTDTCRAIDLFSQYLPEDKRAQLVAVAKNHYARSAFGLALSFLQQKQFAAASAQVNAALELEPTVQNEQIAQEIRNQIPAAVLNESTADASNAVQPQSLVNFFDQEEVENIQHLVIAFQAAPVDDSSQKPLRDLRKGLADYLLGAQSSDLKSLMGGSYGKVFELILNSGLQDESLTSEESNFADSLVGGFDGEGQFDLRRLMASMLFWRAHRTATLLAVELIPSWFFESYINYLIFSPEAFQEIGEAELYRKNIHNVLSEFWRRIEESPRSPLSLKLSQIVASRLNLIPLYFNEQGNKDTYILRSKFIGHFLESRGLKLAETSQKASSARKRIKVGFLNAHFTSQTETYTTIPTFSHLDRSKFEVILYCLGASGGPLENFCRNCADSFVVLPQALDEQIKKIRSDKLDALVIGTNVTAVTNQAALLASARLAPVQLINNSSPVTSGMPHVDGYLSGTFLVDEKSGEEYSEKLCLLDGPSHCFNYEVDRREPVVKLDRAGLGIPQDAVVYFSGANCFKIIPEMQEAWARILAKVPGSVLLLHPFNPNWASKYPVLRFERNMLAAFARHGVEANRLVLSRERLPSRSDVLGLIKLSDIYLDSFPFAGVNSAVDPLEVGIPLVACEMQTFRSRMAGSLLRELKIEELIATGEQDYIDLATRLGLDPAYRAEVSQKIVSGMGQNPRFLDSAAYSANMGRIIESLVGRLLPEAMPKNGDFTIQDAQTVFSKGRLSDAEDICREILGKDERCAGAWHLMGKMAALQGDLETGGDFASVACDLEPQNAEFIRGLAEVFFQKRELEPAEQQTRRALETSPNSPEGLVLLGRILADKDEKAASLEAFQEAVRLRKDYAEGFSHYALALQKFGRGKDAISQIRKACALDPESVEFQTNLAMLLEQNARYMDALAAYGKASRMNPNVGFVWFRQGRLLNGLKRYAEAIPMFEKAVSLPGQQGEYHYELGVALHMSKRFQEALAQYQKALSMGYNTAALQCNCGVIYKDLRKGGDAIMAFHSAVTMEPTNVSYLNNLGAAALELGLNSEALECFEQAVEQNPKLPTARNNIGNLLKDRGRGMDALPQYKKSMELNPDDRDVQSNYLLCHMYIPEIDPKVVFEEHKKWGLSTTKKIPPAFKFKPRQPGSKIRVGFLSADLCHHPVAYFIEPLFREYDREHFEFVAYGDQRNSDGYSARFATQVDLWRETSSYEDSKLAKLIYEDRLDILFELSGHTAYNRLGVFAQKPAPLQVSYLGYPGTSGLPTIGYRITDAFADPPGTTEQLHTEKLIRLSGCAWCFQPDAAAPEVQPLPALQNGYVTFGCFNNMAKLNPELFETWAEILLRVPGSHLRLKARTLTDDGVRKELKAYFTDRGIEEERLDFFGHTKKIVEHLNHYHSVDIALDSFPYHGTTTTCEAMWMGCPVVTRAGKTHVSRVGVSLLNAVGLPEFVTETREAYIAKAADLSSNVDRLVKLRAGMRARLQSSTLMDSRAFAGNFALALNEIVVAR